MSGTTSESTTSPTTTTMDTDKVEETQHSLESSVAVTANTSTTTDNNNNANTNAIHVDTVNPAITPLQSAGTSNTIATEINNHHHPPATTTAATISTPPPRLPYKYDPDKITLRFLFANRDGLTVTVTCNPSDTIGEVKGALISIWPKGKKDISATISPTNFQSYFHGSS